MEGDKKAGDPEELGQLRGGEKEREGKREARRGCRGFCRRRTREERSDQLRQTRRLPRRPKEVTGGVMRTVCKRRGDGKK